MADLLFHLRAGVYTCGAGGTILLYDMLLTSKDEIRLIWPSRFSLVKCLYFVNRYLPVPCLILGMYHLANLRGPLSTNFCKLVTLSQMIGQALSLIAATWLLVLRVLALYSGNKLVAVALYFVFLSTHITTIVLSALILKELWGGLTYLPFPGICAAYPSRMLGVVYFAPVICEIVLVAMQLFHAYRHTFHAYTLKTLWRPTTPLLRTLYADGFAYFVVVVTLRLWSAFIFIFADVSYWYLSTYLEFALISTSVSRLVLHLRGTAELHRHTNLQTSTPIPLSQLAQTTNSDANVHANYNTNPNRNSNRLSNKFLGKPNRNSHQPQHQHRNQNHNRNQDHHRKQRRNHTSSSFQNAAETIYSYRSDIAQDHHFSSSSEYLRRAESIGSASMVSMGYRGGGRGGGTDGSRSLVTIHEGYGEGYVGGHRCDLCCDDFEGDGVVGASRRADDDHAYVELFPASPIRMESVPPSPLPPLPPPGMAGVDADVEGGGYGYDERHGVRLGRTGDARVSSYGIG